MLSAERPQTGRLLLPSHTCLRNRLLLERTEGRVVEMRYSGWGIPDIGLHGQRIRAAPKAPLRKRPTPFPERCPSILFIFKKGQEGACQIVQIFCEDAGLPPEAKET
jgi:hypothetical protein